MLDNYLIDSPGEVLFVFAGGMGTLSILATATPGGRLIPEIRVSEQYVRIRYENGTTTVIPWCALQQIDVNPR